ncbi:MAG: hypothetical protein R3175_15300 [Marinobacter sp.]|uniref:hypothetical protein n=1 Tax=Marinobacter sp. TaxID=50741 RepID=UPI00299EB75D|nr:hypothetical protein [Marinobacter sp.]MDX1757422.1 hypothetical protein [Marinobacter sp.]
MNGWRNLHYGLLLWLVIALMGCSQSESGLELSLSPAQLDWVGQRIFQNECSGRYHCLVHWNEGEAFPSLGIGHFIWYPAGVEGRFVESFPALIDFMRARAVPLPPWLAGLDPFDAPWPDRASFLARQAQPEVAELRRFLERTRGEQVAFIFRRAEAALARVIAAAPDDRQGRLRQRLAALAETPGGVYALLDYVNFKGEGLSPSERYQGQGWGLLQVLQAMAGDEGGSALVQFRQAAAQVLTRRAHNADNPIERERWLPGWLKRLETYREPAPLG